MDQPREQAPTSPAVTVVVPVYNMERSLNDCVRSIMAQSCHDLEIIIVDDKSLDSSLEVAHALAAKHQNIKVLEMPSHQGSYQTRVNGILHAAGEYLAFADADDTMEPRAIELMLQMARDLDVDLVQMRFKRKLKGLSVKYLEQWDDTLASRRIDGIDFRSLASYVGMDSYISPSCWGKLYKTALLKSLQFMNFCQFWGDDQIFNIQYLRAARSMAFLDYVGYNYHWGGETTSKYRFSLLQDYKRVHQLKRMLGQSEQYINAELIQLLRYHVRQLITEIGWTPAAVEKVLRKELLDPIWKQVGLGLSATEILEQEGENIRRSPFKYLVKKLLK